MSTGNLHGIPRVWKCRTDRHALLEMTILVLIYPLYTHYIYNTYTHYIIYPSYTHYLSILILPFDVPFDIPHVKIPMTHRRGDRLWEPGVLREQLRATEFPSRLDLRSPGRRGVSEQWLDVVRNLMAGDEGFMMFMIDIRYGEGFGIFVFKIFIQIVLLLSFICWSLS